MPTFLQEASLNSDDMLHLYGDTLQTDHANTLAVLKPVKSNLLKPYSTPLWTNVLHSLCTIIKLICVQTDKMYARGHTSVSRKHSASNSGREHSVTRIIYSVLLFHGLHFNAQIPTAAVA
jgi:hypothetical protein